MLIRRLEAADKRLQPLLLSEVPIEETQFAIRNIYRARDVDVLYNDWWVVSVKYVR
jgi:hypothetical protein